MWKEQTMEKNFIILFYWGMYFSKYGWAYREGLTGPDSSPLIESVIYPPASPCTHGRGGLLELIP